MFRQMSLTTNIFLVLIMLMMTAWTSDQREKMRAELVLRTVAIRNTEMTLPNELRRMIADFVYYDWESLLDVFPETTESHKFRNYVNQCIQLRRIELNRNFESAGFVDRSDVLAEVDEVEWPDNDPITVDERGSIIAIALDDQQLTDHSIGDLSKLPSTLRRLHLMDNRLTTLDVAALPRGLELLCLAHNELTALNFTKLPPALLDLFVSWNMLSSVDLTKLPRHLRYLWLRNNVLTSVDLGKVPRTLCHIDLMLNYLDDSDFRTLPCDDRETVVTGRGNQRT